jgi:antibiotic biosynthesis monooxygenase (ABM) superfamily enzyme
MTMETDVPKVATAVTAVQVRQGEEGAFASWLAQLNETVSTFPGYVSAVVIPPVPPVQSDWVMVQRFQALEQLRGWLDSDARRSLMAKSVSLLVDEGTTNVIEGVSTESPQDMVTEVITVSVKPGMEEAYRDWVDRLRQVEAGFPGYRGLQLQPPIPGLQNDWVSLLRFDTAEHLNAWLESDARRIALQEAGQFIDRSREQQVATSFSGWFTFGDIPGQQAPPNWKQAMIVLLTLFPVVMLELLVLSPLLQSLNLSVATFIGNAISVAALTWVLVPPANRAFDWWLRPRSNDSLSMEAAGIALLIGGYVISIAAFYFLV